MNRSTRTPILGLLAAGMIGLGSTAHVSAATFVAGADPTTTFSDLLLDDAEGGGGGDTGTSQNFNPSRYLNFTTGNGPLDISITGIGFDARGGTATTLETVTVTVTYFGADDAFGGLDDVLLGSETATLQYISVDSYTAVFDNPIAGTIDGENNRFRFAISSTGDLRFKTRPANEAVSGQGGLKLSVGGTAVVPEPSSLALIGLGGLACLRRRRA